MATHSSSADAPTLTVEPAAGVGVVFNGAVKHAGRPVTEGVRHVLREPRVADLMLQTGGKTISEYFELQRQRRKMEAEWTRWMDAEGLDVLLVPVAPLPAFRHGDSRYLTSSFGTTFWANLLQCPAGVAPWTTVRSDECTYASKHNDRWTEAARRTMEGAAGLPVGVQVLARHHCDETCVAALRVLEAVRPAPARRTAE